MATRDAIQRMTENAISENTASLNVLAEQINDMSARLASLDAAVVEMQKTLDDLAALVKRSTPIVPIVAKAEATTTPAKIAKK